MAVTNEVLRKNIVTILEDISTLFLRANETNTRGRTVYYKAMLISASSIIEGLLHHMVIRACINNSKLLNDSEHIRYRNVHVVSKELVGDEKEIVIAERYILPFEPTKANFQALSIFCRNNNFIRPELFNEVDYVRRKRNQIHIQTLDSANRSYTWAMVARALNTISLLLDGLHEEEIFAEPLKNTP